MANLNAAARRLVRSLDVTAKRIDRYFAEAKEFAAKHGRSDVSGGMDSRQLRQRLKAEVIARLSPRMPAGQRPLIELEGAPEARRFAQAHPLPGLS